MNNPHVDDAIAALTTFCHEIEHSLELKGFVAPDCDVKINWFADEVWRIHYGYSVASERYANYEICREEDPLTFEEMKDRIRRSVAALKTPEEQKADAFRRKLGRLLDEAREIGMDDMIVNPLAELAQKLSHNILEAAE